MHTFFCLFVIAANILADCFSFWGLVFLVASFLAPASERKSLREMPRVMLVLPILIITALLDIIAVCLLLTVSATT